MDRGSNSEIGSFCYVIRFDKLEQQQEREGKYQLHRLFRQEMH